MPIILQVGDILSIATVAQCGGQEALNTFHFLVTAIGASPATDLDCVQTLDARIATDFKGLLPSNARYNGTLGGIITRTPPPIKQQSTAGAGAGSNGTLPLPKQACGITSWYTNSSGRAFRGRTYWPFLSSNYAGTNGELITAAATQMDLCAADVFGMTSISTSGRTATLQHSIYHRALKTTTPIVTRLTRTVVATQRRRSDYGRPNTPPI